MHLRLSDRLPWLLLWLLVGAAGALLLAQRELARARESFEVQARIAHRLLSQRAAQQDAVLATLALLQPGEKDEAVPRLSSIHPDILGVQRRPGTSPWPGPLAQSLGEAEARSRERRQPVLASADLAGGRAWLALAAAPASYAMQVDLKAPLGLPEDPATPRPGFLLEHAGQRLQLQPASRVGGWTRFEVHKPLASASQPFTLVASRGVGAAELPWLPMLAWLLGSGAVLALAAAWTRQRAQRRRAEDLLRLGQVGRLNTLGELGAGLAHELNQPLAAILADSQAAVRLLAEDEPDLPGARQAVQHAVQQARRARDVVQRLRRLIEKPQQPAGHQQVALLGATREVLQLLAPELESRQIATRTEGDAALRVQAEPVAVEQVIHNLLLNAIQALEQVPEARRSISVQTLREPGTGVLRVQDSGPGIPPEQRQRIFEPFFTTRPQGLGLGLSLCQSLAEGMGGELRLHQAAGQGACFELRLPAASA